MAASPTRSSSLSSEQASAPRFRVDWREGRRDLPWGSLELGALHSRRTVHRGCQRADDVRERGRVLSLTLRMATTSSVRGFLRIDPPARIEPCAGSSRCFICRPPPVRIEPCAGSSRCFICRPRAQKPRRLALSTWNQGRRRLLFPDRDREPRRRGERIGRASGQGESRGRRNARFTPIVGQGSSPSGTPTNLAASARSEGGTTACARAGRATAYLSEAHESARSPRSTECFSPAFGLAMSSRPYHARDSGHSLPSVA